MITIILGDSGSGKDTASNYLEREHNYTNIRLLDDLKNYLQFYFKSSSLNTIEGKSYEIGTLEKQEFKDYFKVWLLGRFNDFDIVNLIMNHYDELVLGTLGDFMYKLYFICEQYAIQFTLPYLQRLPLHNHNYENRYVINGLRNIYEVDFFNEYDYNVIYIIRNNYNRLESDRKVVRIFNLLVSGDNNGYILDNNGTIDKLYSQLDELRLNINY